MKNHFYYLFLATAIVGFGFVNQAYSADDGYDLSGVTSTSSSSTTGSAHTGTAAQGTGNDPSTGLRNTNVPFSQYGTYDQSPDAGKPYDGIPINQMNALMNGQKIFDQYAANYAAAPPAAGTPGTGTQSQTPNGRNASYTGFNGKPTGLPPTTTALQAGAYAGLPGQYYFTPIPTNPRETYGFNHAPSMTYRGIGNAYSNNGPYGGQLPPTGTGGIDLKVWYAPDGPRHPNNPP